MVILTKEFDDKFLDDLYNLTIGTTYLNKYKIKGSYSKKKNIDKKFTEKFIITDIDIHIDLKSIELNDILLNDIKILINNCNNETNNFIYMGTMINYDLITEVPWKWDNKGECIIESNDVLLSWFFKLKNYKLLSEFVLSEIYELLFNKTITYKNLIHIEKILSFYLDNIHLTIDDFNSGLYNGKKIIEFIDNNYIILNFGYIYNQNIIAIDFTINSNLSNSNNYSIYYDGDIYKILKYLSWQVFNVERTNILKLLFSLSDLRVFYYYFYIYYLYKYFNDIKCTNINKLNKYIKNISYIQSNINLTIKVLKQKYSNNIENLNQLSLYINEIDIFGYFKNINIIDNITNNILLDKINTEYNLNIYNKLSNQVFILNELIEKLYIKNLLTKNNIQRNIYKIYYSNNINYDKTTKKYKCSLFLINNSQYNKLFLLSKKILINPIFFINCILELFSNCSNNNLIYNYINNTISNYSKKYITQSDLDKYNNNQLLNLRLQIIYNK